MNTLYLAGRYFNQVARPSATLTATPAANSVFPATNLGDNNPSSPCIHGSAAANSEIRYEGLVANGGFESNLTGWTTSGASVTTTAGEFRTGSKAMKLVAGGGLQDLIVASGETVYFSAYLRAPTGSDTGEIFITDLTTGYYLNTSGVWVPGGPLPAFTAATNTGVNFVQRTRSFTVPDFETSRVDYHVIRLAIDGGGTVFVDDVEFQPAVTFASLHGHNLSPMMAPLVQSSDDASSWTTRGAMTVRRGAFYVTFSAVHARYWRFLYDGGSSYANATAPYIGEAVLGLHRTSAARPLWSPVVSREFPGFRQTGTSGVATAYNTATDPTESIGMDFLAVSATAEKDLYDNLWLRSRQGESPVIIVPRDDEAAVYYGHLMEPYKHSRPFGDARPTDLFLKGAPFPSVGL